MAKKDRDPEDLLFSVTKKDLVWKTFRAGGKGGQHQNKADSAARCTHPPSGAVGESREDRSQHRNRQIAFGRLARSPEFLAWIKLESARHRGLEADIERAVDRLMAEENLLIEVKDEEGRWVPMNQS